MGMGRVEEGRKGMEEGEEGGGGEWGRGRGVCLLEPIKFKHSWKNQIITIVKLMLCYGDLRQPI